MSRVRVRSLRFGLVVAACVARPSYSDASPSSVQSVSRDHVLSLSVDDIDGQPIAFGSFFNKIMLITNVASE